MQTGIEIDGSWSTMQQETDFWADLQTTHPITVTVAGRTVLGNPIWRVDAGNPTGPTILFVGAIHGRELSGREACMIWARDRIPELSTYLATHRIVMIPNANADAASMFTRNNANNVNLNRDYIQLTQPETRTVKRVINDVQPQIILDLHEVDATLDAEHDWRPYAAGLPGTHPLIQAAADACLGSAKSAVATAGYSSLDYLRVNMPWGGASTLAGAFHTVGILSEPSMRLPRIDRVEVTKKLFDSVVVWHQSHQTELVDAISASKDAALSSTADFRLPAGPYLPNETVVADPGSYSPAWDIPAELAELHNLEVTTAGIATAQESRLIVPFLFDPASYDYVVGSEWWEPVDPSPGTEAAGFGVFIKSDGVIRQVLGVRVKSDGVIRDVGTI